MTEPKVVKRWRAQFSLRTLLVLMLGTAVCCALVAAQYRAKQRESAIVEKLRHASVHVVYDWQEKGLSEPSGPSWLRKVLGDNFFSEVYQAIVFGLNYDDATLREVAELSSLKLLTVCAPRVTPAGFVHLARLRQLEDLTFRGEQIDDSCLLKFAHLNNVTNLLIQETSVTDTGLAPVRHWRHLRMFWVDQSPITDASLGYLRGKRELHWVELEGTAISDTGIANLQKLTSLKTLCLGGTNISDLGLKYLADLRNLEHLDLSDTRVSDAGMAHLAKMGKLQTLIVSRTNVHDQGLDAIARLESLKSLGIEGPPWGPPDNRITDAGLAALTPLKHLEWLSLAHTGVGDACVKHLGRLKSLTALQLQDTEVSPQGLLRLQRLLPNAQILPVPPSGPAAAAAGTAAATRRLKRQPVSPEGAN